jgi:uncharacterized damage-inducible protein DinB
MPTTTIAGEGMVRPAFVRTMAAYNAEMNRRIYAAAARLSDDERRQARGAFWGSIHGTLGHLAWADQIWMSRFDGGAKPSATLKESAGLTEEFAELTRRRAELDKSISAWAARVDEGWLGQDQVWFSQAAQKEMRSPRAFLVAHFFNHQAHHRGQAHAMITAAGEETGDTDLILLV